MAAWTSFAETGPSARLTSSTTSLADTLGLAFVAGSGRSATSGMGKVNRVPAGIRGCQSTGRENRANGAYVTVTRVSRMLAWAFCYTFILPYG